MTTSIDHYAPPATPSIVRTSIASALAAADGRPAGFDYLRLALACLVVASHCVNVTMGQSAANAFFFSGFRPALLFILPSFFALSGFLVAGSLTRCASLSGFMYLRMVRLLPALSVEVMFSAFFIGLYFTNLPTAQYLSHPEFRAYFLNFFGIIHYTLPGVFENSVLPRIVNGQLWTIPSELRCYLVLCGLVVFRLHRFPKLFLLAVIFFETANFIDSLYFHPEAGVFSSQRTLVLSFLWGVLSYIYREKIIFNAWFLGLSIFAILGLSFVTGGEKLIAIFVAYLTVFIGTRNFPRNWFVQSSDYSYGMYLYGFPIQQALVAIWPWPMTWWENIFWSLLFAAFLAALSWHFVETPALRLKKYAKSFDAFFLKLPFGNLISLR
jgi:peptidoglycan/LPS O-acetylase OafA/YrhL